MTKEDLFPQAEDRLSVAGWLHCAPEEIRGRSAMVPIHQISKQIAECKASYAIFPKDFSRTRTILRKLKAGETAFPLYIEEGDSRLFVIEGRHRMVAFSEFGMDQVHVVFVKKEIS